MIFNADADSFVPAPAHPPEHDGEDDARRAQDEAENQQHAAEEIDGVVPRELRELA